MQLQSGVWFFRWYKIATIPTCGLWVLWLLLEAATQLYSWISTLVEGTWGWMRSMPFWIFSIWNGFSRMKYSITFVMNSVVVIHLRWLMEIYFCLCLYYIHWVSRHRKFSATATQPLLTNYRTKLNLKCTHFKRILYRWFLQSFCEYIFFII